MLRKTLLASGSLATILAACQASAQPSTETFTYDPLGRLIKAEVTDGPSDGEVRDYAYDDAGNRTLVTNGTGGSSPTPTPTPTPSLSVSNASVSEGGTASFTVSLSAAGSSTITTQYATSSAGSASSNDFSARSGTLTFSAGQTSKTVSVPTIEDSAVESNETFYLDLSNANGATIADGRGVGTIVNDDSAPANNPPATSPDYVTGQCYNFVTVNLTANDSDPEGHTPLVVTGISRTSGSGIASIISSSSVRVELGGQWSTGYFTYTVRDSQGATSTGQLTASATSCGGGISPFSEPQTTGKDGSNS